MHRRSLPELCGRADMLYRLGGMLGYLRLKIPHHIPLRHAEPSAGQVSRVHMHAYPQQYIQLSPFPLGIREC